MSSKRGNFRNPKLLLVQKIVPARLNQSIDFPQDYGTLWLGFHVQGAFPAIWMRGLQTPRCWGHVAAEIGAGMFPTTELLAWEGCKKDMSLQGHGNFVIFFTYYFTSEPIPATKE